MDSTSRPPFNYENQQAADHESLNGVNPEMTASPF
jgi:hypothetical protein